MSRVGRVAKLEKQQPFMTAEIAAIARGMIPERAAAYVAGGLTQAAAMDAAKQWAEGYIADPFGAMKTMTDDDLTALVAALPGPGNYDFTGVSDDQLRRWARGEF
jgi:hypothetical protein